MNSIYKLLLISIISSMVLLHSCAEDEGGPTVPDRDELIAKYNLQTLPDIPYPPDNQYNPLRVELGRLLFYDPILSGENRSTCATCHHPGLGFADGRKLPAGVGESMHLGPDRELGTSIFSGLPIGDVPRNSPTVFNTAFNLDSTGEANHMGVMFWDGRARGLEAQAVKPSTSREEMKGDRLSPNNAIYFLCRDIEKTPEYIELFKEAFPEEVDGENIDITSDILGKALGAFQRELVTRNTAYDRFVGGEAEALTDQQKKGLDLFFTKAKCGNCHNGPNFSNYQFTVSGVPQIGPGKKLEPGEDYGREEFTQQISGRFAFRTPTLRNVTLTAPFMHDGVLETLEDVVRFYNDGSKPRHPKVTDAMIHPDVRDPLNLTDDEIAAIVAFMEALEDNGSLLDPKLMEVPSSVPSGMKPLAGATLNK